METGRRFPMNKAQLGPILVKHGISVGGGWFSGLRLDGDIKVERDRIAWQYAFFKAADAPGIVDGETARSVEGIRSASFATKRRLRAQ
jgi:inosose dehydratase